MTHAWPQARLLVFLAAALTINVVDAAIVGAHAAGPRAWWVAAGAALDLVGVVALLYYFLLVRPGHRGWPSLAFVAGASVIRAALVLPTSAGARMAAVGVVEAGFIGAVAWAVWRSRGSATGLREHDRDPLAALRASVGGVVPTPWLGDVLATEIAVLRYALGPARPHVPADAETFSMERRSGLAGMLVVLAAVALLEIGIVHVFLIRWWPAAAWAATAIGLYGVLYLRGLVRAIGARPVLVVDDRVVVRYGLTFEASVPRESIASLDPASAADRADVTLPKRRRPAWRITCRTPVVARGMFGRPRQVTTIAMTVDDDHGFGLALRRLLDGPPRGT